MTIGEYRKELTNLTPEQYAEFQKAFGGGEMTIEQRVQDFIHHPEHERQICHLLGLVTESEKALHVAEDAARAHKWAIISAVSAAVSAAAAVLSIFY